MSRGTRVRWMAWLLLAGMVPVLGGCGDEPRISVTPWDGGARADADATVVGLPDGRTVDLLVVRAVPSHGPFTGGAVVVLRGAGFTADATVTVGGRAVQAADIRLIDTRRLEIVTPAGDVGPADVVVTVGTSAVTLAGGYTYDQFYVDPARGSVAGGTVISVIGSGTAFAAGDSVTLGTAPCTSLSVVSVTVMTCTTPAMTVGSVDVTVTRAVDGTTSTVDNGFTYYDSTDPFAGGLGGGPILGAINVTVLNGGNGDPLPDAFVIMGESLATPHQGFSDLRGQITFSALDLTGRRTIHISKHCFESTSFVSFDARDITVFLIPWMDPMCGDGGGPPPTGAGRQGTFISGELIWLGPNEYGPNPWDNIPDERADEVKVAYVYTTNRCADLSSPSCRNPDPNQGGAIHRVLEVPPMSGDHRGYPYRIFARPAGLAVYALAGLENTVTNNFIPYVMGIARSVLGGPGEEVTGADMLMDIPLDHTLDVRISGLPGPARTGPDRFKAEAHIDLGGEGVIVRQVNGGTYDVVRQRRSERLFRFWSQPALFGALSDGRYRVEGGWYTGDFDSSPSTVIVQNGVRNVSDAVLLDSFLGIPQAASPAYGDALPADRILRWTADGPAPDFYVALVIGGDGNPSWRHFVRGDTQEAPIPNLSSIAGVDDISAGFIIWGVFAISIPGFQFDELSYRHLDDRFWSHHARDFFSARY